MDCLRIENRLLVGLWIGSVVLVYVVWMVDMWMMIVVECGVFVEDFDWLIDE